MGYLHFLKNARKQAENNDDDAGGGGGGGDDDKNKPSSFSQEQVNAAVQAAVNKAVTDAVAANNTKRDESEAGLKKNRDTLKQEKIDLQKKFQDNQDAQRMMDGDVAAVTAEIETRVKASYVDQLAEANGNVDKLQKTLDNNTIHGALDVLINDLKVKSTLRNALKAELLAENEVKLVNGIVMLGELDAKIFMSDWAKNDRSKDFILADGNSGGGGGGSRNTDGQDSSTDMMSLSGADLFDSAHEQTKK